MSTELVIFTVNGIRISGIAGALPIQDKLPDINRYSCFFGDEGQTQKINTEEVADLRVTRQDMSLAVVDDNATAAFKDSLTDIKKRISDSCNVYAVLHKGFGGDNSVRLSLLHETFGDRLIACITESEDRNSVYGKYLIPLLSGYSRERFERLIKYFPDIELENCICAYKSLKLLPLKLAGNWSRTRFDEEIIFLEGRFIKDRALINLIKSLEFNDHIPDYLGQLASIEKKIIKLASRKK